MEKKTTLNSEYFKKVYAANDDPWNFETSKYEAEKYAATLASLPKDSYDKGLEIGCSIGVLTLLLSQRCKHLLSTDISQKALDQAAGRCKKLKNVSFEKISFPKELPNDQFDLIMISEVAYYLSLADWELAMTRLYAIMQPTANVVLVNWLPEVHDYPQTGDEVHESFAKFMEDKMTNVFNSRAENYRIDVWEKTEAE